MDAAAGGAGHRDARAPEIFRAARRRAASSRRASSSSPTCRREDGGKAIVAGNERVLRARLSDANFFWDQDRKVTLDEPRAGARRRSSSTPSSARVARQGRAPGGAGRRARAAHSRRRRRPGAQRGAAGQGRSRHRHGRRVPRAAGRHGPLLRACTRARRRRSPTRSPSTTRRWARTTAARRRRSASPSRSPTRSTRWSASSPSTRSRPARRIPSRCAARRSASSG